MAVALSDVVRATQEMNQPGVGAIQNVYFLQNQGAAISDAQAVSDIIEVLTALAALLVAAINVLQVVDGVRMINVTPVPPTDVGFGVFADTTPYTAAGQILPTQVALGVNFHTTRLAVSGRKYWGVPVVGGFLNGGAVSPGTLAVLTTAATAMLSPIVATNSTWRYGVIASFDKVFLGFASFSLPAMAIVQRRRRATVGI